MTQERRKIQVWVFFSEGGEHRFLLLKTTAARGGFWQPVTGSVEAGEEIRAAAEREMREETGLEASSLRPVSQPFRFESRGEPVVEHPFLAEVPASAREGVRLDPREHDALEWVSAGTAAARVEFESNARVLRDALEFLEQNKGRPGR